MTREKEQQIYKDYPKIFPKGDNYTAMESCMCYGLAVCEEWLPLVDQLCSSIQHYIDCNVEDGQIVAEQVKEKYEGLRFYYRWEGDPSTYNMAMVSGMVWLAEEMSYKI